MEIYKLITQNTKTSQRNNLQKYSWKCFSEDFFYSIRSFIPYSMGLMCHLLF